ncbi:hypothetical protein V7I42_08230 [Raoultella ornithinolytica]|uniref:hypothetical protein n=1 Tax=Raoultella ornithinolytica TaxID=54291 RepID=UPI002FF08F45
MSQRSSEFEAFIADVERADDYPIVVSKYGFKKINVGGRVFLTPNTEEEFIEIYSKTNGLSISEVKNDLEQILSRSCYGGGPTAECYPNEGCTYCKANYFGTGWNCTCVKA